MVLAVLGANALASPIERETLARERPDAAKPATRATPTKKSDAPESAAPPPLLATLAQTHTDERVMLDREGPNLTRFEALLADRTTGSSRPLDARLLDLLRALSMHYGAPASPPRIEHVSGYRSPKLIEILRKKGHHVASHSQHSQGHAVDFRILPAGATKALDPRVVEKEIRALGWDGGVGTYPTSADWFVHADVGPNRRWVN